MVFTSRFTEIKIPQDGIYKYVTSNPNNIPDDKIIFIDGVNNKNLTFGRFKNESRKFAALLKNRIGFKQGDVLMILSPNHIDYPIVLLGTNAAGGIVTLANPNNTPSELRHQLIDSKASVLITHQNSLDVVVQVSKEAKIPVFNIFLFGDEELNGCKPFRPELIDEHEIEPVDYSLEESISTVAYLCYTSGTTGMQKGVQLTHMNVVSNLAQIASFEKDLNSQSIIMGVLPFFHSYALTCVVHATLLHGATTVILPSFNAKTFCHCIRKYKIDYIHIVPQAIFELVKDQSLEHDFSSVKTVVSSTAPLSNQLIQEFYKCFKVQIKQAYGLTETSPVLIYSDSKNIVSGSIGFLLPNIKAKILSTEDGRGSYLHLLHLNMDKSYMYIIELGPNEYGELCVSGPNIMKGYLKDVKDIEQPFDENGFFHTGDLVSIDEKGIPTHLFTNIYLLTFIINL
ncbi:acetyl-CoA synthetase-like protein [Gigaspora margarita]|uniref:Acetyl-CoA synthetase-like protein n=1 Tax=Gigaspora margarita TaxID=4874 RepID=A0A8H4EI63_GIGMA|nr:acetyl-CoA synthetase-like protein [Gigaspora margarita]